ncbi:kinesin-like protein KIF3A isoform X2 [Bolinopsis microptera]|uniref:kinesin-like protein KIF3A isoform X2 n=1 Tax=Bolinopsis microptera TaxID=2820187 RepID=UPI00307A9E29
MSERECTSVKVAIRVRPLLERERIKRCKECLIVLPNKSQLALGKDQNFTFDHVFEESISQDNLYCETVKPLVLSCLDGYNATVFAYGQTGSGKTYTIEGVDSDPDLQGIIPRAAADFFNLIDTSDSDKDTFVLKVSYLEIYLDEVRDLLSNTAEEIHIREDDRGNTVIQGLKEVPVTSSDELQKIMRYGMAVRTTGATQMNEQSSRSHAILTIHINKQSPKSVRNIEVTSAKFHFVDLAGSERAHRTGNIGERFKESVHINSGLLALGNVISALSDSKRKSGHVPYRASKITRLLKDSLGGNSRTLMITCVSPSSDSFEETLNALKYAKRARDIQNRPIVNKDVIELEMQRMESEILQLRQQLKTRENSSSEVSGSDIESLQEEKSHLESELDSYKQFVRSCRSDVERCISKKSTAGLAKLLEKIKSRDTKQGGSSSDISDGVFDEDSDVVSQLRGELKKCREDLLNDEKIFADQQLDFEQVKSELNEKMSRYEDEIHSLKIEIDKMREGVDENLNTTLKKKSIKITRTKPCTFEEIEEIMRKKTFVIFEKNIKNCLENTKPRAKSEMLETFTVPQPSKCTIKDHCNLESRMEDLVKKNESLANEVNQMKDTTVNVHETKKHLEKNISTIRKQKSDLEKRLKDAEKDLSKLQAKNKKEKLVSLGRDKMGKRMSETAVNTSQSSFVPPHNKDDKEIEETLEKIMEERQRLRVREEEIKLREQALKEKEAIESEIKKLRSKEVRASQVVSKDLLRMSMKLDKLDTEIANKSLCLSRTQTLSKSVGLEAEIRDLQRKRAEITGKVESLNKKVNLGELLTSEESTEYRDLNEALEITEAAIEYRSNADTENGGPDTASRLPSTQAVTDTLFNKLIITREENNTVLQQNQLLKIELENRTSELNSLNKTLLSTSLVAETPQPPTTPNPVMAQMERDVAYYKQLVKDLKAKLRGTSPRDNTGASAGTDTLSGGVLTPVRKSKRELRPITAEEAFHRSGTGFNTSGVNSSVP